MASLDTKLTNWLNSELILKQLKSPLGYMLVAVIVVVIALTSAVLGLKGGLALLGVVIGVPVLINCFLNLEFGVYVTITLSFFVNFLRKFADIPFGTLLDGLLLVMALGLIYRMIKERNYSFANNSVSIMVLLWIGYNLLQVLNPYTPSIIGWAFSVRSLALWIILYFVVCYAFKSVNAVLRLLTLIIALTTISALYGLKQEFIGFTSQEMAWLYADPLRFRLFFTWSRLRIFSFFSDPTSFGIALSYIGCFCLILATATKFANWKRITLVVVAMLLFSTMMYTGSRTPVILIPAGIILYTLMNLRKESFFIAIIAGLIGGVFMLKSTSNPVLFRVQSAFNAKEDSSMQLRLKNQNFIQPYIQSHPIGLGLGSIGVWGRRFNADSWLATFAPDSAYVRIAVEIGWIGLIIYLVLLGVALRSAVYYFYRVKDPTIKVIYLGLANILFLLAIANYPQEATYMLPTNLVFNAVLALVVRLKDFDENFKED